MKATPKLPRKLKKAAKKYFRTAKMMNLMMDCLNYRTELGCSYIDDLARLTKIQKDMQHPYPITKYIKKMERIFPIAIQNLRKRAMIAWKAELLNRQKKDN